MAANQDPRNIKDILDSLAKKGRSFRGRWDRLGNYSWDIGGIFILALSIMILIASLFPGLVEGSFLLRLAELIQIGVGWGGFFLMLSYVLFNRFEIISIVGILYKRRSEGLKTGVLFVRKSLASFFFESVLLITLNWEARMVIIIIDVTKFLYQYSFLQGGIIKTIKDLNVNQYNVGLAKSILHNLASFFQAPSHEAGETSCPR